MNTHALLAKICMCLLLMWSFFTGDCDATTPWDSPQQNDAFLELLKNEPPVGINIFSHFDAATGKVPDARGFDYDVTVTGPTPVNRDGSGGCEHKFSQRRLVASRIPNNLDDLACTAG